MADSLRLVLRGQAKWDLREAVKRYNVARPGLGDQFGLEVEETLQRIQTLPRGAPRVSGSVRRARVNRFPYGVFFLLSEVAIEVIAILHNARDPRIWKKRAP